MKFSQILDKRAIIADLTASDKKGVIDELSAAVSTTTSAPAKDIAAVLMEREQLGSTGIGGGIAIPHGKLVTVKSIRIGFGLSKKGVEYDSLDNKPVHLFFLLLTPENSAGEHLKVLAQISKLLKMDQFKKKLLAADCIDAIYDSIIEQDEDFLNKMQKVYIITGLSGSGKTTAIQAFEDASFYCVDNMPIQLLQKFLDLPLKENPEIKGLVFVMDMRSKDFILDYGPGILSLGDRGISLRIIFLEADEDTLFKRFSETRRQHPVSNEKSLLISIKREKEMMLPIKQTAHHIINTTGLNTHQLKSRILDLINDGCTMSCLTKINVVSFGFKYGIPYDADLIVDMRFLANPYFVPELRHQDGESEAVRQFVLSNNETIIFIEKYLNLLDYLIPLYKRENKSYLTLAIGCTGGRHRSVVIARNIFEHLNKKGLNPGLIHRDIDRDLKET